MIKSPVTTYSDSLLKLLESVISKLSIQIIWKSDPFSVFIIFKKDKSYKRYLLAKKLIHILVISLFTCLSAPTDEVKKPNTIMIEVCDGHVAD